MVKRRMVRYVGLLTLISLLVFAAIGCAGDDTSSDEDTFVVGITQILEHDSLDAAREGFIDGLKDSGYIEGENIVFDFKNAQNDKSNALTIAQKFVNDGVDMIFAISTPSAQSVAQVTSEIPILITAVTDPVDAGLVKSMEKPGTNVTGTTDMNPIYEQLELVKEFVPDAENIGVIYNAGEDNSVVQVEIAKEAAGELGFNLVEASVATTADVSQAAASLAGRVDAIYIPTDNTVVAALDTVLKVAEENKIPVLAGEGDTVKNGALATIGIEYYGLGRQTGEMAAKLLKGEGEPSTMPVESQKDLRLYINKTAAATMGVEIPDELLRRADEIFE